MPAELLSLAVACVGGLAGACIGTGIVLWCSHRWRRLVVPSERGAHSIPMPTAGGLGIVFGFLLGHGILGSDLSIYWLSAIGLLLVAAVDDLVRPLKVWEKTLLLLVAAAVFLWGMMPVYTSWTEYSYWLWPLGLCWFFGLCNVVNFMDGIDGISAIQTLIVAGWLAVFLQPIDVELASRAWILVAASAGFLFYNFPPARIFMGDTGSLFIGFCTAALVVHGVALGLPFYYAIILLGYYLFDTSYTLCRRMQHRENLLNAHNKHLYQRLVRIGWSHARVNLWAGALTAFNGIGVYCLVREWPLVGAGLIGISLLVLLYSVYWIERRDACFA